MQFLRTLWNHLQAQWKQRNIIVHGQDHNPAEQLANSQIQALYAEKSKLLEPYRRWLDTPLDELLSSSVDYKQAWIATTAPVIQQGLRVSTRLQAHNQRSILDFFSYSQPSHPSNTSADPSRLDNSPPTPD